MKRPKEVHTNEFFTPKNLANRKSRGKNLEVTFLSSLSLNLNLVSCKKKSGLACMQFYDFDCPQLYRNQYPAEWERKCIGFCLTFFY